MPWKGLGRVWSEPVFSSQIALMTLGAVVWRNSRDPERPKLGSQDLALGLLIQGSYTIGSLISRGGNQGGRNRDRNRNRSGWKQREVWERDKGGVRVETSGSEWKEAETCGDGWKVVRDNQRYVEGVEMCDIHWVSSHP